MLNALSFVITFHLEIGKPVSELKITVDNTGTINFECYLIKDIDDIDIAGVIQ